VKNLRTGIGCGTPVKQSLASLGQWVKLMRVAEREIVGRIRVVRLLTPGTQGLTEANIQRH
jgi:hypothetical protein